MDGKCIIHIGAEPVQLFFGYTANRTLVQECILYREKCLTESGELTQYAVAVLFQAAYLNHCMNAKHPTVFVFDDFMEYADTADQAELLKALEVWSLSKQTEKMLKGMAEKKSQLEKTTSDITTTSNESVTGSSASGPGN